MSRYLMAAVSTMVLLAACGKEGGDAPTGQVVATVGGQEITSTELMMELGAAKASNPQMQKQLEKAALQSIVNRKLLVGAAREQGLDKSPTFAMQEQKAKELVTIGALQEKVRASVPAPSREEAESFIAGHPDSFAQRKLYTLDQLIIPAVDAEIVQAIRPLKTLAQLEALLTERKVPFQRGVAALDGVAADPELIKKIAALPAGEVFVIPNGGGMVANQIRDTRVEPIGGPVAVAAAQSMLRQIRTQQIVRNQLQQIIQAGAGSVKYNDAYAPTKAPVGAAKAEPKATP